MEDERMVKVKPDKTNPRSEGCACRKGLVIIPHGFGLINGDQVYGLNVNHLTKNTHRSLFGTPIHRFVPCRIEPA